MPARQDWLMIDCKYDSEIDFGKSPNGVKDITDFGDAPNDG